MEHATYFNTSHRILTDREAVGGALAVTTSKLITSPSFPHVPLAFRWRMCAFFFALCCCSCHFHHFRGARYAIPTLWPDLSPAPFGISASERARARVCVCVWQVGKDHARGEGGGTVQGIILIPAALAKFTSINGCNGKS